MPEKFQPQKTNLRPLETLLKTAGVDAKTAERAAEEYEKDAPDPTLINLLKAD